MRLIEKGSQESDPEKWKKFLLCQRRGDDGRDGCLAVLEVGFDNIRIHRLRPDNVYQWWPMVDCPCCGNEIQIEREDIPRPILEQLVNRGASEKGSRPKPTVVIGSGEPEFDIKQRTTPIVCDRQSNCDPVGCGALFEIAFADLFVGAFRGTCWVHHYAGVFCPVCNKDNLVRQLSDSGWSVLMASEKAKTPVFHHDERAEMLGTKSPLLDNRS